MPSHQTFHGGILVAAVRLQGWLITQNKVATDLFFYIVLFLWSFCERLFKKKKRKRRQLSWLLSGTAAAPSACTAMVISSQLLSILVC